MTKRVEPQDQAVTKSGQVPIDDEGVRRQLEMLFGQSVFGSWPELARNVTPERRSGRKRVWLVRLTVLSALLAALWGANALFRPGLSRQDAAEREHYATELRSFISDGDLGNAAKFLPLVRGPDEGSRHGEAIVKDAQLDLIVTAEAVLYRYFDADPARIDRIRPYVDGVALKTPARQIAAFTILSQDERASRLAELERLWNDFPNHNELEFLRATALGSRGDEKAAHDAWARSANLGPAWMVHRFEQAKFEALHGSVPAARKVASQMARVDPDSPWSKLALSTFGGEVAQGTLSIRGDAAAPVASNVQVFCEKLQKSIEISKRSDLEQAKMQLQEAVAAIHQQAPFILDGLGWLVAEKQWVLARELTTLPGWPKDNPVAQAMLARLADATKLSSPPSAPPVPSIAVGEGSVAPATSAAAKPQKKTRVATRKRR